MNVAGAVPHPILNLVSYKLSQYNPLLLNSAVHNTCATPCIHLALSCSPKQEVQNIFKAKHPMDAEITKAKVGVVWYF